MSAEDELARIVIELRGVLHMAINRDGHTHNCRPNKRWMVGCSKFCQAARLALAKAEGEPLALERQTGG